MAKEMKPVIAIDVGTAQVRVVAARPDLEGKMELIAFGKAASVGVERGIVTNIDEASRAIRNAFNDAGVDNRFRGGRLYAGLGGKQMSSYNATGKTLSSRSDSLITEKDLAKALLGAKPTDLVAGVTLVHVVPRAYRVDGHRAQQEVLGMRGAKLEVDCHVVTAGETAVTNLRKAVQMAGGEIDQLVSGGIASAQTCLKTEEREIGVLFVNIGAGTTDIVAYSEGGLLHSSCLPLGGNQLCNDVAIALNTSFGVAEQVVQEHGRGSNLGIQPEDELEIQCFGARGTRLVRRRYLNEIIRLRLTEILQLAVGRMQQAAPGLRLPAGLVISGGVATLPSIDVLAETALKMPSRVGGFTQNGEGPAALEGTGFTTAIGILEVAADSRFTLVEEQKGRSPLKMLPQLIGIKA